MRSEWCLGCRNMNARSLVHGDCRYLTTIPALPATWLYHIMVTFCHENGSTWWEAQRMGCISRYMLDWWAFSGWIRHNWFMPPRWIQTCTSSIGQARVGTMCPIKSRTTHRMRRWTLLEGTNEFIEIVVPKKENRREDRRAGGVGLI